MASIFLKGALGLGAASVAVGGTFLYKSMKNNPKQEENKGRTIKNIDQLAFDTTNNTTSLKWELVTGTGEVIVKGTKTENDTNLWQCTIQGKTSNSEEHKQFKTSEQISNLLGIQEDKTINPGKIEGFKKFVENCIRFRLDEVKDNSSEVRIEIGNLEKESDGKYKFKEEDLQKLITTNLFKDKLKDEIKLPDSCLNLIDNPSDSCTLTKDNLKLVNFSNKGDGDLNISEGASATLKIEKTNEIDVFANGLKFIFETTQNIDIPGKTNSKKISLKTGKTEFKVGSNDEKFSLEEAWDRKALGSKVGLNCQTSTPNVCSLERNSKTNVYKSGTEYFLGVTFTGSLTYAEDSTGYNKGLKLTVTGSKDIDLKKEDKIVSQLKHSAATYEIGTKDIKGENIWFLIEKTN